MFVRVMLTALALLAGCAGGSRAQQDLLGAILSARPPGGVELVDSDRDVQDALAKIGASIRAGRSDEAGPFVPQQSERIPIMQNVPTRSWEYKNAFLYVAIREEAGTGPGNYIFSSGINTKWFCRLAWKKAGICSNPAVRGIQLLRTHVSRFAAEHGMTADKAEGIDLFNPAPRGDGWWK